MKNFKAYLNEAKTPEVALYDVVAKRNPKFKAPVDRETFLWMFTTSKHRGVDVLQYVSNFFKFSDKEWEELVDGEKYAKWVWSRKPADKRELAKIILKKFVEKR